jgi:hypothetical protein
MTLCELVNEVDVQGECTVAVYDYDTSEYITKYNTYNLSYNEHIRHRYGEYIVHFIYNGDDGETVIEIARE